MHIPNTPEIAHKKRETSFWCGRRKRTRLTHQPNLTYFRNIRRGDSVGLGATRSDFIHNSRWLSADGACLVNAVKVRKTILY